MNDEAIRRWYQARQSRLDPAVHPAPEALLALVARQGDEAARLATLDHVMACPACQADFELLRSISTANVNGTMKSLPRWLPLAAAVALVVGAGAVWRFGGDDGDAVVRDAPAGATIALVSPADSAKVERSRAAFVWRSAPGASGYRFELVAENGRLTYGANLVDTAVTIPDSVAIPAGRYRWWVTAMTPAGESMSPLRTLFVP